MDFKKINRAYFIGIGGIGMSALALYFIDHGIEVFGYDRTRTDITKRLETLGVEIHYKDSNELIPKDVVNNEKENTLIVYTPAIPDNHNGLNYFRNNNYTVEKRAKVLGEILKDKYTIAVGGTHGKTSTSCLISHLLNCSNIDHYALLGGISVNYNTNYIFPNNKDADIVVVEADEYDRSFLHLTPDIIVITSTDPDHLDVYENHDNLISAYQQFVNRIKPGGTLISHYSLNLTLPGYALHLYTFGFEKNANFMGFNLKIKDSTYNFDIKAPGFEISELNLHTPGEHNVLNSLAAIAAGSAILDPKQIRKGIKSFKGVKRRFEYILNSKDHVFIDDYAHHPSEISAVVQTLKRIYPGKKLTGIFQPHLYSRTRDFAEEFAGILSEFDEIILLEIYPAREEPIRGVNSKLILDKISNNCKRLVTRNELLELLKNEKNEVITTLGAGDIDLLVEPIKKILLNKLDNE